MDKIYQKLVDTLHSGQEVLLATLYSRSGSAPRTSGARMLLFRDGTIAGTIGGGQLEAVVMDMAKEIFNQKICLIKEFDLTGKDASELAMICGGSVRVLIEYLDPSESIHQEIFSKLIEIQSAHQRAWMVTEIPQLNRPLARVRRSLLLTDGNAVGNLPLELKPFSGYPFGLFIEGAADPIELPDLASCRYPILMDHLGQKLLLEPVFQGGTVYLIGAGHISQYLAPLLRLIDFEVIVLDDRKEYANNERFPDANRIGVIDDFDHALKNEAIDQDSYLVIVTRGHMHDKTVLAQALKTDAGYIGMIGSRRKIKTTFEALINEGFNAADIERVYAPIGLAIGAETPQEIAVCIAAQLIQVRAKAD